jgi:hypothetical protein
VRFATLWQFKTLYVSSQYIYISFQVVKLFFKRPVFYTYTLYMYSYHMHMQESSVCVLLQRAGITRAEYVPLLPAVPRGSQRMLGRIHFTLHAIRIPAAGVCLHYPFLWFKILLRLRTSAAQPTAGPLSWYRQQKYPRLTICDAVYSCRFQNYSRLSIIRAWFNRFAAQPRQCI